MAKKKSKKKKKAVKKVKKTHPSLKLRRAKGKIRKAPKPIELKELVHKARIRVIGIGGGGSSIVSEIAPQLKKVDFVVANTDSQALKQAVKGVKTFHFGQEFTRGLGCGMDAKIGQKAAKEAKTQITKLFKGIDLCIFVACLGAGTGSGAAPEFAKIAKEMKVMTFGIFTLPFKFEGGKKIQIAKASLKRIAPHLNALAIIPNENIFQIIDKNTPLKEAFSTINRRLTASLKALCEMVYVTGLINIDFADLRSILDGKGKLAYLNSSLTQGQNRIEEALKLVLKSPLNEYSIQGADKIIFNITASHDLGMKEVEQISRTISDYNKRAKIIFGVSQDNSYKDKIRIFLLALGCGKEPKIKFKAKSKPKPEPEPEPLPAEAPTGAKAGEPKPKPKTKAKKRKNPPLPRLRRARKKVNPSSVNISIKEPIPEKSLVRRNALDLKKAVEESEEEILAQERKWDIPAFLRRKEEKEPNQ